jgi:phage shock protein PspC (stress-responsive transcriptional regulator)
MQLRTTLVLIAVLLLGLPAAAHASGSDVIRDCADDGKLDKQYSQKELGDAERNLPSDIDEYTDCRQAIRSAMHGGSGNPGGPGPANAIITASGAVAASQKDIDALTAVQNDSVKGKRRAVHIDGEKVTPGNAGLGGPLAGLAGSNGMPMALVAVIVVLLMLAVVTAYLAAREKFPAVRNVALRVFSR